MLLDGVAGIGQVLKMIPDLILLALALALIPVAFFAADQIRNGAELAVDGLEVGDEGVGRVTEQLVQSFTAVQKGIHGVLKLAAFFRKIRSDGIYFDFRLVSLLPCQFFQTADHLIQSVQGLVGSVLHIPQILQRFFQPGNICGQSIQRLPHLLQSGADQPEGGAVIPQYVLQMIQSFLRILTADDGIQNIFCC